MKETRIFSISATDIAAEQERTRTDSRDRVFNIANVIKLGSIDLAALSPRDVRLKILAVSGEHNVDHAALADTFNIAESRGGKIYPGNSAVGEVVEVGNEVSKFQVGDIVLTHCNGEPDVYGYPLRIWAYDQPESIGWYAEEAVVGDWQIIKAPLDCGLSLWQITALPLRAPTAYHLWRRAIGIFRLKVSADELEVLNVMMFGGGVGELFGMLAKAHGHNVYFCSGSVERRTALGAMGIQGIDQLRFDRFESKYHVGLFSAEVKRLTGGVGMHIVCDMLRGPCFAAGLAAAARCGVNVSAGWQLSQQVSYNSPLMSVKQITIDHTHYETPEGCEVATALYGSVFRPTVHHEIYPFEDLPRCMMEMHLNQQTGIPIIRVADDMPESVKHLL
jgi:NADPH:quinone reductase-like Zn-dependent oxidoreductase